MISPACAKEQLALTMFVAGRTYRAARVDKSEAVHEHI
jgi:hypothetical protein